LLRKKAEEERKQRWDEVKASDAFIQEVHESSTGISSNSFQLISENQNKQGDTIIEFEAVQWLETEFTVNEPHQFKVKGRVLIRKDGTIDLI
jgi:hypothetical protein